MRDIEDEGIPITHIYRYARILGWKGPKILSTDAI